MSSSYLENLFGLSGKTALCTGASRGIGAKMAEAVAKAGADVILVQVRPIYLLDVIHEAIKLTWVFLPCVPQSAMPA